jgi:hypothetical protein
MVFMHQFEVILKIAAPCGAAIYSAYIQVNP